VGKPEGKRATGILRYWSENNIKIYHKEIVGMYGLKWSGWGQGQMTDSCEHENETADSTKYWEIYD
jgi:hypothetical protein